MVFCHSCGKENEDSSNFCTGCGAKLMNRPVKCLRCGEINAPDSNFCSKCGNDLKLIRDEFEGRTVMIRQRRNPMNFGGKAVGRAHRDNAGGYDNPYEKFHRASELYFDHDFENAIPLFEEIIDGSESYSETVGLAYSHLAWCLEEIHDYDGAVSVISQHIEMKRRLGLDYEDLKADIADVRRSEISYRCAKLNRKAVSMFYGGDYDGAERLFSECADMGSNLEQTYDLLASIHIRRRDFESAKMVLEKGVENVDPGDNLARRLERIEAYLETGVLRGEAMPYDGKAVKSEIRHAKNVLNYDREEGIRLLEDILKKGTYSNTAYYTLYHAYMEDERYGDAVRISDLAIESLGLFDSNGLEKWKGYRQMAMSGM